MKRLIALAALVLIAVSCLFFVSGAEDKTISSILIAGSIVALVMLGGTIFSLYLERRIKSQQLENAGFNRRS